MTLIDPNVMRDAAEYLKQYYSTTEKKCVLIVYEFRKMVGMTNDTIIVVLRRYDTGSWGAYKSYSYDELKFFAEKYNV